jgi:long-chain fatty acid transport protein
MSATRPLLVLAVVFATVAAHAGGLYLPVRGVRATGRGGAFVAGADDPQALWYDPAGLAELAGGPESVELLVDAALVNHALTYTRIDSGGNTRAPVTSDPQALPLPTLAAAIVLPRGLILGVGLLAPYSSLDGFPADGAQRYALIDIHHSVIATIEAALAYQVTDWLMLGAGVQNLVVHLSSRTTFSSCPGELVCAPEDPEFDALGEIIGTSAWNPSAVFGVKLRPAPWLRLGAAFQLPTDVSMGATVHVRLPSSGFFNGSHVEGDQADLKTTFPAMARAGVEVRPWPRLRVEAGFDLEFWSQQDQITVTPKGVRVVNAAGVGTYTVGPINLLRKFDDTLALKLGVEGQPLEGVPLTARAGFVHESGASTPAYLSVFTTDTTKDVITVGLGLTTGRVRFDVTYAHVLMADGNVAKGTSCLPQVNPIRTGQGLAAGPCVHDDDPSHVYIGDGLYVSSWDIFGAGATLDF